MGIWWIYHGYIILISWLDVKFPLRSSWWLQTASPEIRVALMGQKYGETVCIGQNLSWTQIYTLIFGAQINTASCWPIPHDGPPATRLQWFAAVALGRGGYMGSCWTWEGQAQNPLKRLLPSTWVYLRACLHIDKSVCIYNTIKYYIYIHMYTIHTIHCRHTYVYVYVYIIYIIYI